MSPRSNSVGAKPPRREPGMAEAVVGVAALRIREHLVRLGDLLEAFGRIRLARDIRVELARELPEGALDLVVVGVARDAQQLVVVTLRCRHRFKVRGAGHASS